MPRYGRHIQETTAWAPVDLNLMAGKPSLLEEQPRSATSLTWVRRSRIF